MAKVAGHLLLVSGHHTPGQAMAPVISPVCPLSPGEPWAPAMPVIPGNPTSPSAPFSPKSPFRPGTRDLLCGVLFLQRTHADMYDCVCCLPDKGAASGCSHNQEMRGGELLSLSSSSVNCSRAVALKTSVICCSPLGPQLSKPGPEAMLWAVGDKRNEVTFVPGIPVTPRSPFGPGLPGKFTVSPISPVTCREEGEL